MSCNSSSNIKSGVSKVTSSKEATRLSIKIPASLSDGLNVGNVIRYNVLTGLYELSSANGTVNSEVVGIIESINSDNSKNVVIYGSINLPSELLLFSPIDFSGASGGNDIFFLSDVEDGKLQNIAPTDNNKVIKAVYQVAPHGSYTGLVVNYIGYALGSDIPAQYTSYVENSDVGMLHHYLTYKTGDTDIDNYPYKITRRIGTQTGIQQDFSKSSLIYFYNKFGTPFGYKERLKLLPTLFPISDAILNWYLFDYIQPINSLYNGQIEQTDIGSNEIILRKAIDSGVNYTLIPTNINTNYWIELTTLSRQSSPDANNNVSNPDAWLGQPVLFSEVNIETIRLPVIGSVNIQAAQVTDLSGNNLISASGLLTLNFIIKTEAATQTITIPSNAVTNRIQTNNLIVNGIDISSKLLELENRLSYLENRLSM